MHRVALLALLGVAAFARQDAPTPEKPPAEVDQAVRARVTEFYNLLKNHEYRKAESFISEDTKDYYYAGSKPEIHKFELVDVEYSDHFERAKATTKCSQTLAVANLPPAEITLKIPTLWRFENGNWFLYENLSKMANPGGLQSKVDALVEAGTVAATGAAPAGIPKEISKDTGFVLRKVEVDRNEVEIAAGATELISISNRSPGPMVLELGYPLKGIEAKLDRSDLRSGEKAVLTLKAGKEPSAGPFYVRVLPTAEVITIRVQVK